MYRRTTTCGRLMENRAERAKLTEITQKAGTAWTERTARGRLRRNAEPSCHLRGHVMDHQGTKRTRTDHPVTSSCLGDLVG